jgi:hypothetical protein
MTPPSLYTINNQLFRDRPYAFKTSGSGAEPQIDGYATICCCTHENSRWAVLINNVYRFYHFCDFFSQAKSYNQQLFVKMTVNYSGTLNILFTLVLKSNDIEFSLRL